MRNSLFIAVLICGCSCGQKKTTTTGHAVVPVVEKQINMTILLDLSDRIDPEKNPAKPEHFERDSALIGYFTDYFIGQMKEKGVPRAKGKMRIIFSPNPADTRINTAAEKCRVDLSAMDIQGKKEVYDSLKSTISSNINYIYTTSINQHLWPGSDIWRFFKNDVKEIAVDPDSSYRNLLVIFTDGYIYHADSKDVSGNRYAYILPGLFDKYKLRNNNHWEEQVDKLDFGLIAKRADLGQLEVLVVEVTPSAEHKDDEDVIKKVMGKWFEEMKVKRWKIVNSNLPVMAEQEIGNFMRG
jgi:hypothetical protein